MITFEINRMLSKRQEIKYLNCGSESLQSRNKVVLKSYKSCAAAGSQKSAADYLEFVQKENQLRAPPVVGVKTSTLKNIY